MNRIWNVFLYVLMAQAMIAQPLHFNRDGEFKIAQFTDLHYKLGQTAASAALKCINEVIEAEQPDLIIVTGDIIYSCPADSTLQAVIRCIDAHNIPFVMLFGNHDDEYGLTNAQLTDIIRRARHCIQPSDPDYVLPIASNDGIKEAALLYCMDSHGYSALPDIKGYAWFNFGQVAWYRSKSESFTLQNNGMPIPALAFFHIPLPEYSEAASTEESVLIGHRLEKVCSGKLNTGLFAAMKEKGDVMGTFCGHDHDNDFTVYHHGIVLGYGRFSGGNTEYNHLANGARIIVLYEGKRRFDTWIRIRRGGVENHTIYPDSYVKDDWRKRPLMND